MYKKFLKLIFIPASICLSVVLYQTIHDEWKKVFHQYFPCTEPITYSVVSIDNRFNISNHDFTDDLAAAESIWETAAKRDLFANKADGSGQVKVSLVYDYRQEATNKLKDLGIVVNDTLASYNGMKAKYDSMQKSFAKDKANYVTQVNAFKAEQKVYAAKVSKWNAQGGAPEKVYAQLNAEAAALQDKFNSIKVLETNVNTQVADINSLALALNKLAATLNLNVKMLNTVGQSRGDEFTEGEYKSDENGEAINIYEFSTKDKLVRVLAHELGHALGLSHVADKNAIMYKSNDGASNDLTTADIIALNQYCKIN